MHHHLRIAFEILPMRCINGGNFVSHIQRVGNLRTFINVAIVSVVATLTPCSAFADQNADGSVIEYAGQRGDLIVSRDGVVYWLSEGDKLFTHDILRARFGDSSTIRYQGCEITLPENEDVVLDSAFCDIIVTEEPTMAATASENGGLRSSVGSATGANAPLIVGGVVLSAGGLVATTNGGNGGTGSAASAAAGAPQAGVDP